MKYLFSIFLIVAGVSFAETFVSGTEDIPMMEGFAECDPETQGLFSAPEGRIVSVVARGKSSWDKVLTFYDTSLKNLGWSCPKTLSAKKSMVFNRNGKEKLTISFIKESNGILFIRFDFVEG